MVGRSSDKNQTMTQKTQALKGVNTGREMAGKFGLKVAS
jgi:hypothetical protein